MPDKKSKKRDAPISYRPPNDLREEFRVRVQASGLSTSGFITKAIFEQTPPRHSRRPALEQKLLARLLGQAAKIHAELHEIGLSGGGAQTNALPIETAMDELIAIRAALLKAMGRNP